MLYVYSYIFELMSYLIGVEQYCIQLLFVLCRVFNQALIIIMIIINQSISVVDVNYL